MDSEQALFAFRPILFLSLFVILFFSGCLVLPSERAKFNTTVCNRFVELTSQSNGTMCARDLVAQLGPELDQLRVYAPEEVRQRENEAASDAVMTFSCAEGSFADGVALSVTRECGNEGLACRSTGAASADCASPAVVSPSVPQDCAPHASTVCRANAVFSFDGCGRPEAAVQTCAADESCVMDQGIASCAKQAVFSSACESGTAALPKVKFVWSFKDIDADFCSQSAYRPQTNPAYESTLKPYAFCDATQFSIALLKKVSTMQDPRTPRTEAVFNATLMSDGFSQDFRNDFDAYFRAQAFADTPQSYIDSHGAWFIDQTKWIFSVRTHRTLSVGESFRVTARDDTAFAGSALTARFTRAGLSAGGQLTGTFELLGADGVVINSEGSATQNYVQFVDSEGNFIVRESILLEDVSVPNTSDYSTARATLRIEGGETVPEPGLYGVRLTVPQQVSAEAPVRVDIVDAFPQLVAQDDNRIHAPNTIERWNHAVAVFDPPRNASPVIAEASYKAVDSNDARGVERTVWESLQFTGVTADYVPLARISQMIGERGNGAVKATYSIPAGTLLRLDKDRNGVTGQAWFLWLDRLFIDSTGKWTASVYYMNQSGLRYYSNPNDLNRMWTAEYPQVPASSALYAMPFDGDLGKTDSGFAREGYGLGYGSIEMPLDIRPGFSVAAQQGGSGAYALTAVKAASENARALDRNVAWRIEADGNARVVQLNASRGVPVILVPTGDIQNARTVSILYKAYGADQQPIRTPLDLVWNVGYSDRCLDYTGSNAAQPDRLIRIGDAVYHGITYDFTAATSQKLPPSTLSRGSVFFTAMVYSPDIRSLEAAGMLIDGVLYAPDPNGAHGDHFAWAWTDPARKTVGYPLVMELNQPNRSVAYLSDLFAHVADGHDVCIQNTTTPRGTVTDFVWEEIAPSAGYTCLSCGGYGSISCEGKCNGDLRALSDGTCGCGPHSFKSPYRDSCTACGSVGDVCCGDSCPVSGYCTFNAYNGTRLCKAECGGDNQACCGDYACNDGLKCTKATNTPPNQWLCRSCGGRGENPCIGPDQQEYCDAGLTVIKEQKPNQAPLVTVFCGQCSLGGLFCESYANAR